MGPALGRSGRAPSGLIRVPNQAPRCCHGLSPLAPLAQGSTCRARQFQDRPPASSRCWPPSASKGPRRLDCPGEDHGGAVGEVMLHLARPRIWLAYDSAVTFEICRQNRNSPQEPLPNTANMPTSPLSIGGSIGCQALLHASRENHTYQRIAFGQGFCWRVDRLAAREQRQMGDNICLEASNWRSAARPRRLGAPIGDCPRMASRCGRRRPL